MTEARVSGQLALAVSAESVVAAAVWETLPPEIQREATVRLARLLARLMEAEHSLRRTFASLLFAIGEPPPWVMKQMGHTTPNLTLAIYAREMDRRDGEPERLKALVEGADWAPMGTSTADQARDTEVSTAA